MASVRRRPSSVPSRVNENAMILFMLMSVASAVVMITFALQGDVAITLGWTVVLLVCYAACLGFLRKVESARSALGKLNKFRESLERRNDANELPLTSQLGTLRKVYPVFFGADIRKDIKVETNRLITGLMSNLDNYEYQRDFLGLSAKELADNLQLLTDAVAGCVSMMQSHLRTVHATDLSDFRESTIRLAAQREVEGK